MEYQTAEIETESRLSVAKFTDAEQNRDTEQANYSHSISVSCIELSRRNPDEITPTFGFHAEKST